MLSIRVFVSALILIAIVILAVPRFSPTTHACPAPPPQPLRLLYKESDVIVVARIGKSVVVETKDNYELLKTGLVVSSTHKGQVDELVIYLYHRAYGEYRGLEGQYKEGDRLLLFLQERGDGYQVDDDNYGIKHLSDPDLQIYLDRISELATILGQGKPNDEQVVEWLVRCAEEPATRWEGAYELASSTYGLNLTEDDSTEDEEAVDEESEEGDQAEETEEAMEAPAEQEDEDADPIFVMLLTEEQKECLAKALFNTPLVNEDEALLVDVVATWHHPNLPTFLISQLNRMVDKPPFVAHNLMYSLAEILNDKSLLKLADTYLTNTSYDDLDGEKSQEGKQAIKGRAEKLKHFLSRAEKRIRR